MPDGDKNSLAVGLCDELAELLGWAGVLNATGVEVTGAVVDAASFAVPVQAAAQRTKPMQEIPATLRQTLVRAE